MYNAIVDSYRWFFGGLIGAWEMFRDASWLGRCATLFVAWALLSTGMFFGTFLIDHSTMILFGYWITYAIYNRRGIQYRVGRAILMAESRDANPSFLRWLKSVLDRLFPITFPVSIIVLWIGGFLPYMNLVPPESVYAGLFPKEWLGVNGNDFMWNGFLLPIIGERIVPLGALSNELTSLGTMYGLLYWASFPFFLGWSVSRGRSTAFLRNRLSTAGLWLERLKILGLFAFWLAVDIAMGFLLVFLS